MFETYDKYKQGYYNGLSGLEDDLLHQAPSEVKELFRQVKEQVSQVEIETDEDLCEMLILYLKEYKETQLKEENDSALPPTWLEMGSNRVLSKEAEPLKAENDTVYPPLELAMATDSDLHKEAGPERHYAVNYVIGYFEEVRRHAAQKLATELVTIPAFVKIRENEVLKKRLLEEFELIKSINHYQLENNFDIYQDLFTKKSITTILKDTNEKLKSNVEADYLVENELIARNDFLPWYSLEQGNAFESEDGVESSSKRRKAIPRAGSAPLLMNEYDVYCSSSSSSDEPPAQSLNSTSEEGTNRKRKRPIVP